MKLLWLLTTYPSRIRWWSPIRSALLTARPNIYSPAGSNVAERVLQESRTRSRVSGVARLEDRTSCRGYRRGERSFRGASPLLQPRL